LVPQAWQLSPRPAPCNGLIDFRAELPRQDTAKLYERLLRQHDRSSRPARPG